MGSRPSIQTLRKLHPAWTWTADRFGMGWRYVGTMGDRSVTIQAFARIVDEDVFATEWRVDVGASSESFLSWSLREETTA